MQPKLELLSGELTSRILDEAFQLMMNPGIKVLSIAARNLLAEAGAQIDREQRYCQNTGECGAGSAETLFPRYFSSSTDLVNAR